MRIRWAAVVLLALIVANSSGQHTNSQISVILGRPTDRSVTLNLLASAPLEVSVEYGTAAGARSRKTAAVTLAAAQPRELSIAVPTARHPYFYTSPAFRALSTPAAPGTVFTSVCKPTAPR